MRRAGERLGLTPSAVSHALARLRDRLGDPLFIRGSHSLQPTARAEDMAPAVRRAMEELERAITLSPFDPATATREFVVVASAYVCSVLLPRVAAAFEAAAPACRLYVRAPEPGLVEALERGGIDVVLCVFASVQPRLTFETLFEETAAWVVRAGHPAAEDGLTVTALARLSRIGISTIDPWNATELRRDDPHPQRVSGWDMAYMKGLEAMGTPRLWVPDVHSALAMVLTTDMTALLPRRLVAAGLETGQLVEANLEIDPPTVRIGAITAQTGRNSPVRWLTDLMASRLAADKTAL